MKFVLAVHGTRGDVEPCAAVGVELRRRGHAVHMAVPPNLIEFVESAGLTGVAYGPDSDEQINTVAAFVRNLTRAQNPLNLARAVKELFVEGWAEMGTTLTTLADGADLVMTGQTYHGVAANVAEYYDIPAAALHHFPMQVNGQIAIPSIPTPATLVRATMKVSWRLYAYVSKDADRAQRRELGLPPAPAPAVRRLAERGAPEIQAYDPVFFPRTGGRMERPPPVCRPADHGVTQRTQRRTRVVDRRRNTTHLLRLRQHARPNARPNARHDLRCLRTARRASPDLFSGSQLHPHSSCRPRETCRPGQLFDHPSQVPRGRPPRCAGTTAAGLRAGMPTLILWDVADQPIWAGAVQRLKVGSAKRFTNITRGSLLKELRSILAPECAARAREISTRMTRPTAAVTAAADLLEATARQTPGSTPSSSPGR